MKCFRMNSAKSCLIRIVMTDRTFWRGFKKKFFYLFLKLQAYLSDGEFTEIQTYDEFFLSDCRLIVLLYDCEMVEIYVKDHGEIESLYQNAITSDFRNVQIITDENDGRTGMNIR